MTMILTFIVYCCLSENKVDWLIDWLNCCFVVVCLSAKVTEIHEITPQSDYVAIQNDGLCSWVPRFEQSAVHCSVDVTWFPFDAQRCDIVFESWILKADELIINVQRSSNIHQFYLPSDEWDLTCTCSSITHYYSFDSMIESYVLLSCVCVGHKVVFYRTKFLCHI